MKKIAFMINSGGWGGLEMNVLHLAGWLKERDWEIIFYTAPGSKFFEKATEMGIPRVHITHRKYFDIAAAHTFAKLLQKEKIQTLMVFQNHDLDFVFWTKRFFYKRLTVIYQQHMQIGIEKKDWLHTLRYSAVDWWISPLEKLKNEVTEKTKLNPQKIKVIPLGVEIHKFYPARYGKTEARKMLKISTGGLLLGIIGRIDPKKGQLFLVKATHELVKKGLEIHLLIMGEPTVNNPAAEKYLQEIEKYVDDHRLQDTIEIKKFSDEVHAFYQSIDIFALASEAETYGMVTIEAMLSQKPIIATPNGGTSEILGNGKFGILYEHNNLEDFCKKVTWVVSHGDQTNELIARGTQAALNTYAHDRECYMIEQLIPNGSLADDLK